MAAAFAADLVAMALYFGALAALKAPREEEAWARGGGGAAARGGGEASNSSSSNSSSRDDPKASSSSSFLLSSRCGVPALAATLNRVLTDAVRGALPDLRAALEEANGR